tara:strand:- start:2795 stop:2986 length:192 start_codon:yes stop_codon:yes gene_type:complete
MSNYDRQKIKRLITTTALIKDVEIKELKNKLAEITYLCEAEIESKGRFDTNGKILEILEVIHE